eukprot:m.309920 g.309920  ORF g.309920 m.309920 type:complete len:148 (+) comp48581_c0_seq1:20-463(+)
MEGQGASSNSQQATGSLPLQVRAQPAKPQAGPAPPPGDTLVHFFQSLEDYTPTIPDAVTSHYLGKAGFETDDPRIIRLVSLAAQKFVSDVANDALQHCRSRGAGQSSKKAGGGSGGSKDKKYTLTVEDLREALSEYGIHLKKPHYFT